MPGIENAIGVIAEIIYRFIPSRKGSLYEKCMALLKGYDTALRKGDSEQATIKRKQILTLLKEVGYAGTI